MRQIGLALAGQWMPPLQAQSAVARNGDHGLSPVGSSMQSADEDNRKLQPFSRVNGHHANYVSSIWWRRFRRALGPSERFQIFQQFGQRTRAIPKLAPQPAEQFFDIRART